MNTKAKPKERIPWLDICKGICIVLVVYGHVSGGLEAADKVDIHSPWFAFRQWIYLFHMPAFFALSGILASKLLKLPPGEFILNRLRNIYFPYVAWTAIIVISQFAMARYANNPPDLARAMAFLVQPYGYGLWFLYCLFIVSTLYYLLLRLKANTPLIMLISLLFSFLAARNVFGFWPILNTAVGYFIYYALAACMNEQILWLLSARGWLKPLVCGTAALLAMSGLYATISKATWFWGLLLACLGTTGVMCLANALARTFTSRFWAVLGLFSLEIYLGHPLWGTLARAVLLRLKIESAPILILGGVFAGVGGSLLVGILCQKFNFPYLFKWPAKRLPRVETVQA